jgi:branched-chain amino acid transport system substrate-binding protein
MNSKSTALWLGLIVLVVIGLWYGSAGKFPSKSNEPVKIGIIASLSGNGASRGESVQMALSLAMEEIKERGLLNGQEVELIYQDVSLDQSKNGPVAFTQLAEIEKVTAIIGPMGSPVAVAVAPLVDERKVPTIIHTASASAAIENNEYVFRLWPTDKTYAEAILSRLEEFDYKKVAIISASLDNTLGLLKFMDEKLDFVADEKTTKDAKDFRTQLAKIKDAQPDLVILNLFTGQNGLAAKQARELGIQSPFVTNSVTSHVDFEHGVEYLEGAWLPEFAGYNDESIREKYISMFGKEVSDPDSAAAAHDALLILAEAIGRVGADKEKVKDYLYENKFKGFLGEVSFSPDGDAVVPLSFEVIKNGKFVGIE